MIKEYLIYKNKKNNLISALLINLLFLIITLIFNSPKYEVSDDFMVDAVLSGAYGYGLNEHMLFQNILLGYILKGLYNIIPGVSWYFIMQILLCFLALTSITYVILSQSSKLIGIILSLVFVAIFSEDVYILVNFTKTAGLVTTAGGALFLYSFWNIVDYKTAKKGDGCLTNKAYDNNASNIPIMKIVIMLIFSIILTLFGIMYRWQCIYISLLVLFPLFIYHSVHYYIVTNKNNSYKHKNKSAYLTALHKCVKPVVICFISCVLFVGGAFTLHNVNKNLWNKEPDYAFFKIYNPIRAHVTDVWNFDYEDYAEELENLDFDANDYYMIRSWNFLDRDHFTEDKLIEFAKIKKSVSKDYSHTASNVMDDLSYRKYLNYHIIWGIAIITVMAIFLAPQKSYWFLISDFIMIGLLVYFFVRGRVLYRVDYTVIASTAIVLCHMLEIKEPVEKSFRTPLLIIASIVMLFKITMFIPDNHYKYQNDEDYRWYVNDKFVNSGTYDVRKYRIDISKRTVYDDIIEYIQDDTEHYYLLDFNTCIQNLYYNFMPWERIPEGIFLNCSFLGSVTTQYPDNNRSWADHGIDTYNPYLSIVNDNIYVVDNYNQNTKLEYLRKMYYPDAWMELIDEIDGFKIWKFHKE